jgi:hypothetical protein
LTAAITNAKMCPLNSFTTRIAIKAATTIAKLKKRLPPTIVKAITAATIVAIKITPFIVALL